MQNIKQKTGFTLVELIVVITILAILWTIAFIALQWYSKASRDSKRIADMSRIKTTLELFQIEAGKYPEPTDVTDMTYSGTIAAWHQGSFWESTFRNVEALDKIPQDPVTESEYTYSVTNNRKEFQIGGILETDDFALGNINTTNAWETLAKAKISWSYNGSVLKVIKGNKLYLLSVPSIICAEWFSLEECLNQNKLVFDWYRNLPPTYAWTQYKSLWEWSSLNLVKSWADILVYSWDGSELNADTEEWKTARQAMVEKLQLAYSDTKISTRDGIRQLVNVDLTNTEAVENVWISFINTRVNSGMITWKRLSVSSDSTSTTETSTWWSTSTDWRAQDPNCDLPDVQIWDQTWAGCNSTLGTGIEFVNSHEISCYDYVWSSNQSCSDTQNLSTAKESDYNSLWVNNIWWKLYTWDNAQNACGTGYHLPSIEEWTQAMIDLGCTDTVSSTTEWWQCAWLWWKNNWTLKDKLKLPLTGDCHVNGVSFFRRGYYTYLWASSVSGSHGRWVYLARNLDTLGRFSRNKSYGFSVRCIKD